jgi:hypothetical protein
MSVIFFDVSGVLMPRRALLQRTNRNGWPADYAPNTCVEFDPAGVSLLARLVDLSGARLVACRDAMRHGLECLERNLFAAGFDPSPHWHEKFRTPPPHGPEGYRQIVAWQQESHDPGRWIHLTAERHCAAPGCIRLDAELGIDLKGYRRGLLLLDALDSAFDPGGGWPEWTEWGERKAAQRWLSAAYAEQRTWLRMMLDAGDKRDLEGVDRSWKHHNRAHAAVAALDAVDPWTAVSGPASYLADPTSIERRSLPELEEADRKSVRALLFWGYGPAVRRRPGAAPAEEEAEPSPPPLTYRGYTAAGIRFDTAKGLFIGCVAEQPMYVFEAGSIDVFIRHFQRAVDQHLEMTAP